MSLVDELAKLHQLKESGALTADEFQLAKQRLLREEAGTPPPPAPATALAEPLREAFADLDDESSSLGVAANRYVSYMNKSAVIGAVVFVIAIIVFAIIFMNAQADFNRSFQQHRTPFEQQFPEGFPR